jgi:hypothetical protein
VLTFMTAKLDPELAIPLSFWRSGATQEAAFPDRLGASQRYLISTTAP